MAGEFLRSHGIDINAEMQRIQFGQDSTQSYESSTTPPPITKIVNASLPNAPSGTTWDVHFHNTPTSAAKGSNPGVSKIFPHDPAHSSDEITEQVIDARSALLAPSLCHPHIHLDKPYLLSHPKYSDLQIQKGDFAEAMELTSKAKAQFEHRDLLERGQRLIDESVSAGVTHIRAFVELDAGVGRKCLDAGLELKRKNATRCIVQLCAFAQLPLFTSSPDDETGAVIRGLMTEAARMQEVDVLGSTPYVKTSLPEQQENVRWIVDLAVQHRKHLDLHLDYHLDATQTPLVHHVIATLHAISWSSSNPQKTIILGHCTRLTLFSPAQWHDLRCSISTLPLYFVGLPTSDLFMMRPTDPLLQRPTLHPGQMIQSYGLKCCLGVNNIGNAFTPQGSADPLFLACQGVGVYQMGRKEDAGVLYGCFSRLAREAIGLGDGGKKGDDVARGQGQESDGDGIDLSVREGDGDLVLFGSEAVEWRTRRSIGEVF
ncbi:hypothetical protein LTR78_006877 [Recurvomyces mirabilis]|uniref:Metallo-dependent hydrolase n=1 Tax=Recurvomyces mirabilis TaxID=574656 RepID=A0AAE0WKD2_9PEZI|nr:hypothetical protein LTR78_006877 [Recurvomyces mirabilis]KAK5153133.1 hypothetical protein LTS14_007777 [Recurvomyces mirabilis]